MVKHDKELTNGSRQQNLQRLLSSKCLKNIYRHTHTHAWMCHSCVAYFYWSCISSISLCLPVFLFPHFMMSIVSVIVSVGVSHISLSLTHIYTRVPCLNTGFECTEFPILFLLACTCYMKCLNCSSHVFECKNEAFNFVNVTFLCGWDVCSSECYFNLCFFIDFCNLPWRCGAGFHILFTCVRDLMMCHWICVQPEVTVVAYSSEGCAASPHALRGSLAPRDVTLLSCGRGGRAGGRTYLAFSSTGGGTVWRISLLLGDLECNDWDLKTKLTCTLTINDWTE
jgi:hypothetical protein